MCIAKPLPERPETPTSGRVLRPHEYYAYNMLIWRPPSFEMGVLEHLPSRDPLLEDLLLLTPVHNVVLDLLRGRSFKIIVWTYQISSTIKAQFQLLFCAFSSAVLAIRSRSLCAFNV